MRSRGESNDEVDELTLELATNFKEEQEVKEFKDKFFSKNLIYGLAGFLSPLLIGPFIAVNIWTLGNRKGIWSILFISLGYLPLIFIAAALTPEGLMGLVLTFLHLGYVVFFVEWTWKKYLPTYEQHKEEQRITT